MKVHSKSSFTLPAEEVKLIETLKAALGAKTNVEVVRQGLKLLKESINRRELRESYRQASSATRASLETELSELDHLSNEGLDK